MNALLALLLAAGAPTATNPPADPSATVGAITREAEQARRRDALAAVEGLLLASNAGATRVDAGCLAGLGFAAVDAGTTAIARAMPDRRYVDAFLESADCGVATAARTTSAPAYPMSRAAWRELEDGDRRRYAAITVDALRVAPDFASCPSLDADGIGIAIDQAVVEGDERPLMMDVADAVYTLCAPSEG